MPREEIEIDAILEMYIQEETAIIQTFNTLTQMEMNYPEQFSQTRQKLRHHLKVINTIVKNLLALEN